VSIKFAVLRLVLLVFSSAFVFAQFPVPFCNAGVQPDGFVDWTKLPPAPTSGAVNFTIPVKGVANLFATFQIPAPSQSLYPPTYYQVQNPATLQLDVGVNPTITFNRPVRGISATFQASGRFEHTFTITAYNYSGGMLTTNAGPAVAQVDSSGYTLIAVATSPLQIRSNSTDLLSASFQFSGDSDEYSSYQLINLQVESGADPAAKVPLTGLREWLRADHVNAHLLGEDFGVVDSWPDQSGHGSDAFPPTSAAAPAVGIDGPYCTAVVSFDFQNQLNFNLPINGWTGMTVFLASQSYADAGGWWENQPLIWGETEPWGSTFFTPSQTNAFFRFGTTQVNNQPVYARPVDIGGSFTVTTAVRDGNTDSLFTNGVLALQQQGKHPAIAGTTPSATIAAGLLNTFFTGNIGEILIYDRALSGTERETVEHYLISKFGVH
jgi:hypothetical protein